MMTVHRELFTKTVIWENLSWEFESSGEGIVVHQILSLYCGIQRASCFHEIESPIRVEYFETYSLQILKKDTVIYMGLKCGFL